MKRRYRWVECKSINWSVNTSLKTSHLAINVSWHPQHPQFLKVLVSGLKIALLVTWDEIMVELFYSKRGWVLRSQLYFLPPPAPSRRSFTISFISYCLKWDLMGSQQLYGGSVNTALPLRCGHWPASRVLLLQVKKPRFTYFKISDFCFHDKCWKRQRAEVSQLSKEAFSTVKGLLGFLPGQSWVMPDLPSTPCSFAPELL